MPCHVSRAASGRIWYRHIAELTNCCNRFRDTRIILFVRVFDGLTRSYIASVSLLLFASVVSSRSDVSFRWTIRVSTSPCLSCMAATVVFSLVVISLIVETSVATDCSVAFILVISVNGLLRWQVATVMWSALVGHTAHAYEILRH